MGFSAPGKVLICGGYTILDQRFRGIVVAADARFHVNITAFKADRLEFSFLSPQFLDSNCIYGFDDSNKLVTIQGDNKFLYTTLLMTLKYIEAQTSKSKLMLSSSLEIVIQGDNDFYSQAEFLGNNKLGFNITAVSNIRKFNHTGGNMRHASKTGLGSSAAMVTAIVASLLHFFDIFQIVDGKICNEDLEIIEKIAHCCHSVAQGNVGSGFDISAACNGSHSYSRYSPAIVKDLFQKSSITSECLAKIVNSKWNTQVKPFGFPHGFILQLGEVRGGSQTPIFISKLLDWRANNFEICEALWLNLHKSQANIQKIFDDLGQICRLQLDEYLYALDNCSNLTGEEIIYSDGQTYNLLSKLYREFNINRRLMREMGDLSGVSIEPVEQTILIEKCLSIPGVIAAGVPGAGGYDAIFCIVISSRSRDRLLEMWRLLPSPVLPLLANYSATGLNFEANNF